MTERTREDTAHPTPTATPNSPYSRRTRNDSTPKVAKSNARTPRKQHKLTIKQERFAYLYDGNGVDAARLAGCKGTAESLATWASETLRLAKVAEIVAQRERRETGTREGIASRAERQQFWTDVMLSADNMTQPVLVGRPPNQEVVNLPPLMKDRLKASELLGKSQMDFIERKELTGEGGGPIETAGTMSVEFLKSLDVAALKKLKAVLKEAGLT